MAAIKGRILDIWFSLGVLFGGLFMVGSVGLLLFNLFKMFMSPQEQQLLTPLVGFFVFLFIR